MARSAQKTRAGMSGVARVALAAVVLTSMAGGAYGLYHYQRKHNSEKLLARAQAAQKEGDISAAATAFRQYLQRNPNDIEAMRDYTAVLLERIKTSPENIRDALAALRRVVRAEPENIDFISKLVGLYLQIGEHGLADNLAESWVVLAPDSIDATLALATAKHGNRKAEEAAALLIQAIGRTPNESRLYPPLVALLEGELDNTDEARSWLGKALIIGENSALVQLAAFNFHRTQNQLKQAEPYLERAIELADDSLEVLASAAVYYVAQNELVKAKTVLDRALESAPENLRLLAIRAIWAVRQNDMHVMVETAELLQSLAGDRSPGLVAQAAELYLRADQLDKADACITQFEELPNRSPQRQAVGRSLRGAFHLLGGRPYEAVPVLKAAYDRRPTDLWTADMLARAYIEIGARDAATGIYRNLSLQTRHHHHATTMLARLALEDGRNKEARRLVDSLSDGNSKDNTNLDLIRAASELLNRSGESEESQPPRSVIDTLNAIAANQPSDPATVMMLSRCFVLCGEGERSVELLGNIFSDIEHPAATLAVGRELGNLLLQDGQIDRAKKIAEELTIRFPDAPDGPALVVQTLVRDGQTDGAESYIHSFDGSDAQRGSLWSALARTLDAKTDETRILDMLRTAVKLRPDDVKLRQQLARLTPDQDEAIAQCDAIHKVEGDAGTQWRFERASALLRFNSDVRTASKAVDLLQQCVTTRPSWVAARLLLGGAQEAAGQLIEAADSYRAAIASKPELRATQVAIRLVRVLKRLGRLLETDAILTELAKALPDSPEVLWLMTEQYVRRGQLDSATDSAQTLLALRSDDPIWAAITADLHLRAGHPERAEQIVDEGLNTNPSATALLLTQARILIVQKQAEKAEQTISQAAMLHNSAGAYMILARVQSYRGRHEVAIESISKAVELAPHDAEILAGVADYWRSRGNRVKQTEFIRRAIELRGEDPTHSLFLAATLIDTGTGEGQSEAATIINTRLAENANDVPAMLLGAQLAMKGDASDLARAEEQLQQVLSVDPRSTTAHRLLALMQIRAGKLREAGQTLDAGLSINPHDVDLLLGAAQLFVHRGEFARSVPHLLGVLEQKPRLFPALRLLTMAYEGLGQIRNGIDLLERQTSPSGATQAELILLSRLYTASDDKPSADELLQQAFQMDRASTSVFQELIRQHAGAGEYDKILELLEQRMSNFPDDVDAQLTAAEVLAGRASNETHRQAGMAVLKKIADSDPSRRADAFFRIGLCHYQLNAFDEAESAFSTAASLSPTAPRPTNALAWLYSENKARPADALKILNTYRDNGGKPDPEMLDTHGSILLRLGRLDEAAQVLTECLSLAGQTPTRTAANYHLGLVLAAQEKPKRSRQYLREALRLHDRVGGLQESERQEAVRLTSHDAADS